MLALTQNWWVPTLRGAAAIAFGLLAIVWPGLALTTMVLLFGTFAMFDGIVALVGLFKGQQGQTPWFMQLLIGVAGIAAGLATFFYPGITAAILLSFIAAYAIVTGIAALVAAVHQRAKPGSASLGWSGALAALLGTLMVFFPAVGAVAVAWVIGVFAIGIGAALVSMGIALRNAKAGRERLTATMVPEAERVRTKT